MGRVVTLASTLLAISCLAVLCSCSTWPDFQVLTAEGEANNAPIIIYGVAWTEPESDKLSKIGFINLQYKDITSIRLSTARCGAKGKVIPVGHVVLTGPFKSRASFIADGPWDDAAERYGWISSGVSGVAVITRVQIEDADGAKLEYEGKEVRPLLDKNMRNYCSNFGP